MNFDDFLPKVIPYVPGCPDAVAIEHIRESARDFCARTLLWEVQSEPVKTRAGIVMYPLDLDDQQERIKVMKAWLDGHEIEVVDPQLGRAMAHRGYGSFLYMDSPVDLVMYPAPTRAGQLIVVQMAVKPTLSADEWPDDFAEYMTDIAYGAVATLCRLPKKTWSDRQMAIDSGMHFVDRVQTVGMRVAQGFTGRFPRRGSRFF